MKSNVHNIELKPVPGMEDKDGVMDGRDVMVYLDGEALLGTRSIKIEADAEKILKVTVELYPQVAVTGRALVEIKYTKEFLEEMCKQVTKRAYQLFNADPQDMGDSFEQALEEFVEEYTES